jgi:hypothetical protein
MQTVRSGLTLLLDRQTIGKIVRFRFGPNLLSIGSRVPQVRIFLCIYYQECTGINEGRWKKNLMPETPDVWEIWVLRAINEGRRRQEMACSVRSGCSPPASTSHSVAAFRQPAGCPAFRHRAPHTIAKRLGVPTAGRLPLLPGGVRLTQSRSGAAFRWPAGFPASRQQVPHAVAHRRGVPLVDELTCGEALEEGGGGEITWRK